MAVLSLPPAVSALPKGLKDMVLLSTLGGGGLLRNTQGLCGVQFRTQECWGRGRGDSGGKQKKPQAQMAYSTSLPE